MTAFRLLATGWIDRRESAFPQAVQLPSGELLCSFSVGGGQYVHGGTDLARSTDAGRSWKVEGQILAPTADPPSANALKLSRSPDGETIYAYGTRYRANQDWRFGDREGETVLCRSNDEGRRWTSPQTVPMPEGPIEVSHSLCPLASGRLLAPGALLRDKQRMGEEVFVVISDDGGQTWPRRSPVFRDPHGTLGFWEQKLVELSPGTLLATAWTVTLGDYLDQPNSFCLSHDDGLTWSDFHSTGIRGQTLSVVPLGGDRLLVLYNRRYGQQGIVAALARLGATTWSIDDEVLLYDAQSSRSGPDAGTTGVDELASFQFGFPTGIRLHDGAVLVTHWCVEDGICGIRWIRLSIAGLPGRAIGPECQ